MTAEEYLKSNWNIYVKLKKSECLKLVQMMKNYAEQVAQQVLEAAAENAEIIDVGDINSNGEHCDYYQIDKQSILNTKIKIP